ncbi:MAG: hypothetical protein HY553_13105 [Elusimicrobia bacterium]|nr:hypothetical protein [Elusimicrobiota bacterium]
MRPAGAIPLLALAFAAGLARAEPPKPPARIDAILEDMDRLAREVEGRHPLEARQLEARLRAYGAEIRLLGPDAVAGLSAALGQMSRPLRARVYAAVFLGMHGDPGGFEPLRARALDPWENAGLRSAALQSLGLLRAGRLAKRRVMDRALADPAAPAPVWREALTLLSELGTSDPDAVLRAASRDGFGPLDGRSAVRAIARSPRAGADAKLLDLLPKLGPESDAEADALLGLAEAPPPAVRPRSVKPVLEILRRRKGRSAVLAARVLARLDAANALDELRRTLQARDPAVVVAAGEELAKLRDAEGARELRRLLERLASDRRFAARPGAETAGLVARLEAAAVLATEPLPAAPEPRPLAPPPSPPGRALFRYDGYPGDERPSVRWKGGPARLFEGPGGEGLWREARLAPGELAWDASVVLTRRAGAAVVRRRLEIEARDHGAFHGGHAGGPGRAERAALEPGETLDILAAVSSGSCLVRRNRGQRLLEMECPQYFPGPYEVLSLPVTEWWVRVQTPEGPGWLTVDRKP